MELLVLSTCRIALGDEDAKLGFAGSAVMAGVKSTLASHLYPGWQSLVRITLME